MKRLLTSTLLVLGLNACSTIANSDFSDRNEMAGTQGYDISDEIRYNEYNQPKTVRTVGALSISSLAKTDAEYDPAVFTIKRYRQKVYAETMMYSSDNKDKTFIDETYFNVGMNKNGKGMTAEVTMKF